MNFYSFYTKYHICLFDEDKNFNEGRFSSAWITWFLRKALSSSEEEDELTYEDWAKSLGIIPFKKKRVTVTKKTEIEQARAFEDMFFSKDWED